MREPYAMRTLIAELREIDPEADLTTTDADGFGVHRTLVVRGTLADRIVPLLFDVTQGQEGVSVTISDKRIITGLWTQGDVEAPSVMSLTFAPDWRADNPGPFSLPAAVGILEG